MIAKRLRALTLVASAATLVLAPSAFAKSYRVDARTTGKSVGTKSTGTAKSKAFGTCVLKGDFQFPKYYTTWKCKGGTLKLTATTTSGTSNDVKFTVKVAGGSGKFKKATGSGTGTGQISTGKFHYLLNVRL